MSSSPWALNIIYVQIAPKFVLLALTCPLSSSHTYDTARLGFPLTPNLTFPHKLLSPLAVFPHYSLHHVNTGVCFDDSSSIPLKLKQTQTPLASPLHLQHNHFSLPTWGEI